MSAESSYERVASKSQLKEGGLLKIEPQGKPIVLAMVGGKVYTIDAVCTHEGGPLEDGKLEGLNFTCPWHYAVFDVRNGNVSDQTVWATDLQSYPVKVDETIVDILLSLQAKKVEQEKSGAEEKRTATQQEERQDRDSDNSQKKYYEAEEQSAGEKITLELISADKLQGTNIMTFKISRGGMDFTAGQYAFFKPDGVAGDSKGPTRHFSIASSPKEQDYMIISTRIRDTPYNKSLHLCKKAQKFWLGARKENLSYTVISQSLPSFCQAGSG